MPLAVSGDIVVALVRLRQENKHWGPKKLRALLPSEGIRVDQLPSVATIGRILKRSGLSKSKGRGRPKALQPTGQVIDAKAPNDVWTVDFKGWWRCGNGKRCEPLTIRDLFSRYLFCLRPMKTRKTKAVKEVFEEMFKTYGLPDVIRSDNGGPFAAMTGLHGLTQLSAWWRSLGIELDRIQPGHPEQNGGHERMHGDMAREIQSAPSATVADEEKRLEHWRIIYNVRRPHEALDMKTPGEFYRLSKRRIENVGPYVYPENYEQRRVRGDGYISLTGRKAFISEALRRRRVGIERLPENAWRVWFCDLELGEIDFALAATLRPTASVPPPKQ
jgi:transposase InsO family protein